MGFTKEKREALTYGSKMLNKNYMSEELNCKSRSGDEDRFKLFVIKKHYTVVNRHMGVVEVSSSLSAHDIIDNASVTIFGSHFGAVL